MRKWRSLLNGLNHYLKFPRYSSRDPAHPVLLSQSNCLPTLWLSPGPSRAETPPVPYLPSSSSVRLVPVCRPLPQPFPQPGVPFLYMALREVGSFLSFRYQLKCRLLRKAFPVHPTENSLPVTLSCITVVSASQQLLISAVWCPVTLGSFGSCVIRASVTQQKPAVGHARVLRLHPLEDRDGRFYHHPQ